MEVFLNIYDVTITKILISDWTADNSCCIALIAFLLILKPLDNIL